MHFPLSLHIGTQSISLHGIFETLGIFAAFRYYLWLRHRQGDAIEGTNRTWIVIAATIGAVLGAHLLGSLENFPEWRTATSALKYFWENKTLVGGLLGGLAAVEGIKLAIGERQNSGDLFVYPLILGMMTGRVGCFTAGVAEETYGNPTRLPWGMNLGDGIARHPVALYEIVFLALLWLSLATIRRRHPLATGALFKLFLISYLTFRFLLDFIKPGWRYALGLGTIQLACLAGLFYYVRYIFKPTLLLHNPPNREATQTTNQLVN